MTGAAAKPVAEEGEPSRWRPEPSEKTTRRAATGGGWSLEGRAGARESAGRRKRAALAAVRALAAELHGGE